MSNIIVFLLCCILLVCSIYGVFYAVLVEEQAACTYYTTPQKPAWCIEFEEFSSNK